MFGCAAEACGSTVPVVRLHCEVVHHLGKRFDDPPPPPTAMVCGNWGVMSAHVAFFVSMEGETLVLLVFDWMIIYNGC